MSAASLAQYGAFLLIVALIVRPVGGISPGSSAASGPGSTR
jgi:hypothetical protein